MAKTRPKPKKGRSLSPLICKGCGIPYIPKSRRQRYHDEDCRVTYYKAHYFHVVEVTKTCPNCGNPFPTTMPKKQTYCTPECRKEAMLKRGDEAVARYDAEHVTYLGERYAAMERDSFKCTVCGRGVPEGAVLDVMDDREGGLTSVCAECKIGKAAQ